MTKTTSSTYTITRDYHKQVTQVLILACMVMTCIYAINLYKVISHSLALQNITKEQASLNSSIQSLDAEYISLSGKITLEMLHNYGFDQGDVSAFIPRKASLGSMTIAGYEL
jgi:hypothetical protein